MKDGIIKGTGNSRYLKSSISAGTTWAQALAMFNAGTFPIDFNGINAEGWTQIASALSKANLLPDNIATALGLTGDPQVSDALSKVADTLAVVARPYNGNVTLAIENWSGTAAPYTYTISTPGMTADDNPYIGVVYSSDEAANNTLDDKWATARIRVYTTADTINIVARGEKPSIAIPIFWRGAR